MSAWGKVSSVASEEWKAERNEGYGGYLREERRGGGGAGDSAHGLSSFELISFHFIAAEAGRPHHLTCTR